MENSLKQPVPYLSLQRELLTVPTAISSPEAFSHVQTAASIAQYATGTSPPKLWCTSMN